MNTIKYDNKKRFLKSTRFLELKRVSKFNFVLFLKQKQYKFINYLNILIYKC